MKLIITFSVKETVLFSSIPTFLHSIFSTILKDFNKGYNKRDYSFSIPRFRALIPGKVYKIEFVSRNDLIIDKIYSEFQNNNKIKESFIQKEDIFFKGRKIKVSGITYKLSEGICKNWKINNNGKILNFKEEYGEELLKELIEYQISKIYKEESLSPSFKFTKKINNKEIFNFIEDLKITKSLFFEIKGYSIPCVDIEFSIKEEIPGRIRNNIGNLIINSGLGGKNSYGFGFAKEI